MAPTKPTTSRSTPSTTARSAGGTRSRGARTTRPRTSTWAWIIGAIIALAVIWFIWRSWADQGIGAEREAVTQGVGLIIAAAEQHGPTYAMDLQHPQLTA